MSKPACDRLRCSFFANVYAISVLMALLSCGDLGMRAFTHYPHRSAQYKLSDGRRWLATGVKQLTMRLHPVVVPFRILLCTYLPLLTQSLNYKRRRS